MPTADFYRALRRELKRADLAHLHSLWNPAISLSALACRRAGVPYVLSPLGMLQTAALSRRGLLKKAYYAAWERRTIAGADALHFLTEREALDSLAWRDRSRRVLVIPNGVELDLADGLCPGRFRQAYPRLAGKRIMLFLGRLHWSKGLEVQAGALGLLATEFPDLMWVLVGPDAGEWGRLSRRVSAMRLDERVLWTGPLPHDRCLEALVDSDVFVLTSRHEAHSMAMNEALAIGVPMLITDTVRFDEVQGAGAGSVVPRDAGRVAQAVADILSRPADAARMRAAGRRLAAERLAWPRIGEAMVEAYGEVLHASAAGV